MWHIYIGENFGIISAYSAVFETLIVFEIIKLWNSQIIMEEAWARKLIIKIRGVI